MEVIKIVKKVSKNPSFCNEIPIKAFDHPSKIKPFEGMYVLGSPFSNTKGEIKVCTSCLSTGVFQNPADAKNVLDVLTRDHQIMEAFKTLKPILSTVQ